METENKSEFLENSNDNYSLMLDSLEKLLEHEIKPDTDLSEIRRYLLSLIEKMRWLDELDDETIELYVDGIDDKIESISKLIHGIVSVNDKYHKGKVENSDYKKKEETDILHLLHTAELVWGRVKSNYFNVDNDF